MAKDRDFALGPSGSQAANNLAVWRGLDTGGENVDGVLAVFAGLPQFFIRKSHRGNQKPNSWTIEFRGEKSVSVLAKRGQPRSFKRA